MDNVFRNCHQCNAIGRDGVEPPESEDNRFTVCPASTYGISSNTCNPVGFVVYTGLRGMLSFQLPALAQGIRYACHPGGITAHAGRGVITLAKRSGSDFDRKCTRRKLHPLFNLPAHLLEDARRFLLRTCAT